MVDKELLSRKLSQLREYLAELRNAEDITWQTYERDLRARAFVERYLQLCIEKVIDIANHFVAFHRWREPGGYRDLFQVLHENGVIPKAHLTTFQNMASFRNMLVHRYEKTDDEIIFSIFRKRLGDFDLFGRLITDWINHHETPPPQKR
ncbi:MAG: DUF86 domain-containing protein [Syntrophobacterales bacterium]|nr:DUF86 domain-containing protein [Syntrophobacterales bacterium]